MRLLGRLLLDVVESVWLGVKAAESKRGVPYGCCINFCANNSFIKVYLIN